MNTKDEREDLKQNVISNNEDPEKIDIFDDAEVVDIAFSIHEPRPN